MVAILNAAGTAVVTYTYDAWGNPLTQTGPLSATLGTHNPLRYRGYVYDTDTGLYYLLSRYYDPQIGRFINADIFTSTGQGLNGTNMFAYCGNNPVSRKDDGGEFWHIVAGAVVGAVFGAASEFTSQLINNMVSGEGFDWGAIAISAAGGAIYGGVMAATGSNTAATIASTVTTSVITGIRNDDSFEKIVVNTAKDTAFAAATCFVPKVINKSLSGKYAKLNKVQKVIKKITDEPYRGKYVSGRNYLPDVFSSGLEDFGKNAIKTIGEALFSLR